MWKNGEIAGRSGEVDQTTKCLICSEREKEELLGGCALDSGVMEEGSPRLSRSLVVKVGFQRTSVSSRNGVALVFLSLLVMGWWTSVWHKINPASCLTQTSVWGAEIYLNHLCVCPTTSSIVVLYTRKMSR